MRGGYAHTFSPRVARTSAEIVPSCKPLADRLLAEEQM